MTRLIDKQLVDNAMAAYVDWREDAVRVRETYASWANATGPAAARAFRKYAAALDREDFTAGIYANLITRVGEVAAPDHQPAAARVAAWGAWRR